MEARITAILSAALAPILTLLVDLNVISALVATDIGAIGFAVSAGYHGTNLVQARKKKASIARHPAGKKVVKNGEAPPVDL